jgi:hypothetical protein
METNETQLATTTPDVLDVIDITTMPRVYRLPGSPKAASTAPKAKDAQYKDAQYKCGYPVAEGGDYIVHKVDPESKSRHAEHVLIRVADGQTLGSYMTRAAACKMAYQFGRDISLRRLAAKGWKRPAKRTGPVR